MNDPCIEHFVRYLENEKNASEHTVSNYLIDNLPVVGRGASYIRRGHDPGTRARITQFHLGQVAGTAAAFAVRDGVGVRKLHVPLLQQELLAQGFFLGETERLSDLGLA